MLKLINPNFFYESRWILKAFSGYAGRFLITPNESFNSRREKRIKTVKIPHHLSLSKHCLSPNVVVIIFIWRRDLYYCFFFSLPTFSRVAEKSYLFPRQNFASKSSFFPPLRLFPLFLWFQFSVIKLYLIWSASLTER